MKARILYVIGVLVLGVCLLWPLGSAAQGSITQGSITTTQDSPPEASPSERYELEGRPDSLIAARIRGVMQHVRAFEDIEVEVRDGVVVLTGEVATGPYREDARELARRFEGVLWVDNRIDVAPDVEQRLGPAFERIQRFRSQFVALLPLIGIIIALIAILWMLGSVIARWEAPASRFGWNPLVWGLIRRMARAILVLAGLLLVFDLLGISALVGALLGTAGVAGIVLGFAFREIAENYLAGILLSIRRPFAIGDLVRIGDHEGHVLRLTSRELVLLTFAGTHVRFPNSTVFKSTILNFSHNPRRRFEFTVGVGTREDLGAAMRIARDTLAAMPGVLEDPMPFVRIGGLGDSHVELLVFGWIDQRDTDFLKVRSEAIRAVKNALDDAGIEMPEPQYNVRLSRHADDRQRIGTTPPEEEVDLRPDGKMDEQLREELDRDDEENLLR
jgi:small conductance mechanosensitive channel